MTGAYPQPLAPGCEPRCPGCRHRQLTYAASCQQKQNWLSQALSPWLEQLQPIVTADPDTRLGYRDKALLSCQWSPTGWQFGLRHRDEIIAIPHCPVHSSRIRATMQLLSAHLPGPEGFHLAYLVQSGAQAVLILKQATLPDLNWLEASLTQSLKELGLDALWIHLHPSAGKKIFTKRGWHCLWGQPWSVDTNGLRYGPAAFQQLIPMMATSALDQAEVFLSPNANSTVVDLYSGTGTSLQRWRNQGATVLGIEIGAQAVACAQYNVPETKVLRGSCLHRLPQLRAWTKTQTGIPLLYLNPPRTGLEKEVCDWVMEEYQPLRMAYLSCSAGTLSRDLSLLGPSYKVRQIIPYDFFPQTQHVETLVLIERNSPIKPTVS